MRDRDGGAVERGEQVLEQRASDRVEVRLGLVEEEHVRVLGEAGGERDQLALPARERARRQEQVGLVDPEVEQHRAPAAVDARPAGGLPALDQLLLAAEHARHPVEIGGELWLGELLGDAVQVAVELVEVGAGRADRLERVPLAAERMLRQERDDDAAAPHRGAGVGLLEPGDQLQHRRLAGAVAPTTPTRAPGSIAKSSPSSTVRLPNDLRTAFSETSATA